MISGLYGLGGIGNTSMALKLAERLTGQYPDAQIYLNLRGTSPRPLTQADALAHVIRSFCTEARLSEDEPTLASQYQSILRGKHALLLMDNARDADQVKDLLPPAGSILLITSRKYFSLPGLPYLKLEQISPSEAVKLALKIAPRMGDSASEMAELCDYPQEAWEDAYLEGKNIFDAMRERQVLYEISEEKPSEAAKGAMQTNLTKPSRGPIIKPVTGQELDAQIQAVAGRYATEDDLPTDEQGNVDDKAILREAGIPVTNEMRLKLRAILNSKF